MSRNAENGPSLEGDVDQVTTVARTLYETDEDMVDEAISARVAAGDPAWSHSRHPRLSWEIIDAELRTAYFRRAIAAIAALSWKTPLPVILACLFL